MDSLARRPRRSGFVPADMALAPVLPPASPGRAVRCRSVLLLNPFYPKDPRASFGKAVRTTFEMRSNQEGTANVPAVPQGNVLIQVNAKGYQTFGETFDVTDDEKTLNITLNPPQQQYSAH